MNRPLGSAVVAAGIGAGFVVFGLDIDVADRIMPIQGHPAFLTAPDSAWLQASLFRFVAGVVVGLGMLAWRAIPPGPRRRFFGLLLGFIAAALLRGSLAAWLNAPVAHFLIAVAVGGACGCVTFALVEMGLFIRNPPAPTRQG